MRNKILIAILYRFFAIAFWFTFIFFISGVAFEIFTEEGKIGNVSRVGHHSQGYAIPIKTNIQLRNTVFNNQKTINIKKGVSESGREWSSGELVYFDEMPEKINKETVNVLSFYYHDKDEVFTTKEASFLGDTYLIVNSDKILPKLLLLLNAYVGIISLMFIFYFLKRIFKSLNEDLKFNSFLFKNVKYLGVVLIVKTVFTIVISFVFASYYSYIKTETLVANENFNAGFQFSINPRIEFDFSLFLIGISLLVLASLLKAGTNLQQENELTI